MEQEDIDLSDVRVNGEFVCISKPESWSESKAEKYYKALCIKKAENDKIRDVGLMNRYKNVFPLMFRKHSEPQTLCGVYDYDRKSWLDSGKKDAGVFTLVTPEDENSWSLYLLGFLTRDDDNIFHGFNIIPKAMFAVIQTDIIPQDNQFVFSTEKLHKSLALEMNYSQERAMMEEYTYKEVSEFGEIYVIPGMKELLSPLFHVRLLQEIFERTDILEILKKRMVFYHILNTRSFASPQNSFDALKNYLVSLNISTVSIQRYSLLLLCIFSSYHESFSKLFIHCERMLAEIICKKSHHRCKTGKSECVIMMHVTNLENIISKISTHKASNPDFPKIFDSFRIRLEKHIETNFGPIANIFDTFSKHCEDTYISV